MKVTLIDYNNNAIDKLLFTKSTRLQMRPDLLKHISELPFDEKIKELEYMANTIRSSWEFLDYTFLIEGVSRAFTHQFVRNRNGSYAQQTMRILDVSGFDYVTGPSIANNPELKIKYDAMMTLINEQYQELIASGAKIEDARGILPTNICTNICVKYNLRTMADLIASRSSPRTQGEFREVMDAMYNEMIKVHPWVELFLKDIKFDAIRTIERAIIDGYEGSEEYLPLIKALDVIRK